MQRQSSFFDKLPPELRCEIYAYALGGERLLVEVAEHHERSDYFRIKCAAGQRLLAFPRSCKIAYVHVDEIVVVSNVLLNQHRYVEATEFIYTSNTFLFDGVVACLCFQRIVPKDFFRSLQSIHLRYDRKNKDRVTFMEEDVPPYDLSSWNYTWLGIAKVEALRYLRVDCVLGPRGHGFYHEEFLLTPLKALHSVEKIEVFTDWSRRDSLNTESWPFSVTMGVEDL